MTMSAITTNREWNTKIISTKQGQVAKEILNEFKELWQDAHTVDYGEYIDEYKKRYRKQQLIREQQRQAALEAVVDFDRYTLKPNKMQVAFIDNLAKMIEQNIDKALLLSSTGERGIFVTGGRNPGFTRASEAWS